MPRSHRLFFFLVTAIGINLGLVYPAGNASLFGASVPFPDELKNPHTVHPEFQFGTYGTEAGELDDPRGICVGDEGQIYIADTSNNRIQVFSRTGRPLRTWGKAGGAAGELITPQAISIGSKGELLVADTGNNRIQVFDANGVQLREWGSYGENLGQFKQP